MSTSWKNKIELARSTVSVKRPIEFIPHGMLRVFDPKLTGTSRFCTVLDGDYATLVSATSSNTSLHLNAGDKKIVVAGWIAVPLGSLFSIGATEHVVASALQYIRDDQDPTIKYTELTIETPLFNSYYANTVVVLVGFPVSLASTYDVGSTNVVFDTPKIVVVGDQLARFHYETDDVIRIPVLEAWQRTKSITDRSDYFDADNEPTHRYIAELALPLPSTWDVDARVFVKAVPAYSSPVLPIDIDGAWLLDAFSGKTFGTGNDNLNFSITLYDAFKQRLSMQAGTKNTTVTFSSFQASDFLLWTTMNMSNKDVVGSVTYVSENSVDFIMSSTGTFSIGEVFPATTLAFRTSFVSTSDFSVFVTTEATREKYTSVDGLLVLDFDQYTTFVYMDFMCAPGAHINVSNVNAQSRVCYISYSFCPDLQDTDRWEGSCLLLKSVFPRYDDLNGTVDSAVMNTGVVMQ